MKAEYYLPTAVSRQLDRHRATARVLTCPDRWYGVTYHEDRASSPRRGCAKQRKASIRGRCGGRNNSE